MTGYGSAETTTEKYLCKVEIKSLNGKFLELNLRLPKIFNDKEIHLRNYLGTKLNRGSVGVYINFERQKTDDADAVQINSKLAEAYYKSFKQLASQLGADDKDIFSTVIQIPELLKLDESGYEDSDWDQLNQTLEMALSTFDSFRIEEGQSLMKILTKHCQNIEVLLEEIQAFESERQENTRLRLEKNQIELANKEGYDQNRFEQELLFYFEKMDISEEKNRLKLHCKYFLETLNTSENGRKLNFIAQEIGREINTLGAKANHAGMQKVVVNMKEELEKIKEQVLNVL